MNSCPKLPAPAGHGGCCRQQACMCVAGHTQKRPAIRSALRFAETLHSGCIAGQFCICARKGGRPPHKRVKPVQGQTHAAQSRPDMVAVPEVRLFMRKAVPPRCLVSIRLRRQIDRGLKQSKQAWRTGSRGDENSRAAVLCRRKLLRASPQAAAEYKVAAQKPAEYRCRTAEPDCTQNLFQIDCDRSRTIRFRCGLLCGSRRLCSLFFRFCLRRRLCAALRQI